MKVSTITVISFHLICLPKSMTVGKENGTLQQMTDKLRRYILDEHNRYRMEVDPPAADMYELRWNEQIEETAGNVAQMCDFLHSEVRERTIDKYYQHETIDGKTFETGCGENLAKHWRHVKIKVNASHVQDGWGYAMTMWGEDEKKDFKYGTHGDGSEYFHYTQMIWNITAEMGCAWAKCNETKREYNDHYGLYYYWYYVCHFCPGGNLGGQLDKPYTAGPWASKCDFGLTTETHDCKLCKSPCYGTKAYNLLGTTSKCLNYQALKKESVCKREMGRCIGELPKPAVEETAINVSVEDLIRKRNCITKCSNINITVCQLKNT